MQSFLILLCTWLFSVYHVSVLSVDSIDEGSSNSSVPNLLWAFPRNGEIITPSSCPELVEEGSIHYPLYFFGWFQPPNYDYEFPLALTVLINNVGNEVPITWRTHDNQGLHLIHQKVYILVAKNVRTLDLVITLSDTRNRVFSDEKITVMLATCDDMKRMKAIPAMDALLASSNKPKDDGIVHSPNYNEYFLRRFLENPQQEQQEGKQKKKKLDFLEIGTSDFDTCIQAVDSMMYSLDEEDAPKYTGISIDAISSYLNKLPNLKSVLKINSAVIPSAGKQPIVGANFLTNISSYEIHDDWYWESVYFIPDFVIHALFSDTYYWLRGIAEVGVASPHSASYLLKVPASPALIIKEFIPTMKIGYLLSLITEYYPDGVNLLKVDIEGMDQSVIYDALLFYYHHQVSIQTASYFSAPIQQIGYKWPCVLFFETVTYIEDRSGIGTVIERTWLFPSDGEDIAMESK
jgi:hypothetical protein